MKDIKKTIPPISPLEKRHVPYLDNVKDRNGISHILKNDSSLKFQSAIQFLLFLLRRRVTVKSGNPNFAEFLSVS